LFFLFFQKVTFYEASMFTKSIFSGMNTQGRGDPGALRAVMPPGPGQTGVSFGVDRLENRHEENLP
jgi:hypothetical protein